MSNPLESPAPDPRVIADQIAYWNEDAGRTWVARQEAGDATLAPVAAAALARADPRPGESAIDIGCGCGATALELAARLGERGRVLGIDISKPMLARARERAAAIPAIEFIEADATTHGFEPARFDLLFSRFGVMFFPDPVRAFANLRRALKPAGRMVFACFRAPRENQYLMTALAAVTEFVPPLPKLAPEAPGPFAFADATRVRRILGEAGFAAIALEPVDLKLDAGSGKGLDEAVINAMEIGPAASALRGQPPERRARAEAALRKTLAAHETGGRIELAAAIWVVSAKQAR